MANRKLVCFGEALIDLLNTGSDHSGDTALNQFTQYPGGAPANVAVAAAKLGVPTRFLGQVGNDTFGDFLLRCLKQYGVDTSLTLRHPTAKTSLAFVFLDDTGDRSFEFYRDDTADTLMQADQLESAHFDDCGLLHFCSNTLTSKSLQLTTAAAIELARAQQALVSFDVNLRHNLWRAGAADGDVVNAFVRSADILKFSRDELEFLCKDSPFVGDVDGYVQAILAGTPQLILVTDGGEAVQCYTRDTRFAVAIPPIKVVDTTAGGDGFTGGLLRKVLEHGLVDLLGDKWLLEDSVRFATLSGAIAVSRPGAFPALPTLADIENFK
ncbi:carbohydrate kinase [Microbulbifer sp. YPW1]|uniref:carbohydrate kinase family protein n=1 Tax=Microbulbifer sp. YPW1 TaxID=2745199 RepID=UPI00159B541F|nr:carbohydrate kinase [Microbulbifer sp. YPW1]QKX17600.1 carbohydrate kinase [Microbulbifer sp. YPW1]